tara:strand:- start:1045 stop:1254 length:210 start_codon:yes stop_codon:yes gene_type:complete
MAELPAVLTNWTTSEFGTWFVPISVLALGAGHFGYAFGMEDRSFGPSWLTLGNAMGATGVIVGLSMVMA